MSTMIMHIKKVIQRSVVQLSAECLDLLNHIMVPSEEERYSIAEIKSHPWYNKPLSLKFAQAEKEIQQEQAAILKRDSQRHVNNVRRTLVAHFHTLLYHFMSLQLILSQIIPPHPASPHCAHPFLPCPAPLSPPLPRLAFLRFKSLLCYYLRLQRLLGMSSSAL